LAGFRSCWMWRCRLVLAACKVPRHTRVAIALVASVVSRLSRAPVSSLSGSCLRRLYRLDA
jgi:hypothetical protein